MNDARTAHPYVTARFPRQLEMVRSSRQRVDVATVPRGYVLRAFNDGDEPAYQELFRLAWPDVDTLPYTKAHALPGGLFVVEEARTSRLVASCVAFAPETPSHGENGSLGWLVVDAAHGRRGLGTVLAATATNRLIEEQYALPWLGTEDDRLVALGIYLALDWEPHLYEEGMEARWREVAGRLGRRSS